MISSRRFIVLGFHSTEVLVSSVLLAEREKSQLNQVPQNIFISLLIKFKVGLLVVCFMQ
jgi:hypothetical protein